MAWHYPQTFDPQGAILCMCKVSLVPNGGKWRSLNPLLEQGIVKDFTRGKTGYLLCFCFYSLFGGQTGV